MQDVFSSLPGALRGFAENERAREAIVIAAWHRAVGTGLGGHTAPVGLNGKVLTVAVASETWKRQIADLAGQILFKLNGALGSSTVSYIDLIVDAKFVRRLNRISNRPSDDADRRKLAEDELTPKLESAANEIKDETLRQLFLNASTSSLARQEMDRHRGG